MKRITIAILCMVFASTQLIATGVRNEAQRFMEILHYIDMMYVDTANLNTLTTDAIVKMLGELDPHSQYIEADEVEAMTEHIKGNFEGIGVSYNVINDTLVVIQAISGGPSEKVGILPGDRIVSVDGKSICGKAAKRSDIQKYLRGKKGTTVNVDVVRYGEKEKLAFSIVRDVIPIHSVDVSYMIDTERGYIKLNTFSRTTMEEMLFAIGKLKGEGMNHLILDLQSNGGGLLHASIELVDQFLGNGKLIVYTEGVHQRRVEAKATSQGVLEDMRVTVLIDEYSASASEIVSGALQDWDRGEIIGRRSYGKGLVQRPITLSDGGELRLTTARYYTPSGRNIQKPYKGGRKAYFRELEKRYSHGEFQHADSISFPDSLKYKTLGEGRTVYGGGGIFPDVFVPLDTVLYTRYYRALLSKGVMMSVVSGYLDKESKRLGSKYSDSKDFEMNFEVGDKLTRELIKEGNKRGAKYDEGDYKKSEDLINNQLKALIGRRLYGEETFYRFINRNNQILQVAIGRE